MNTWHLTKALVFLQTRSLANAVKVRLRRLKQPKYLIGAVVGLGYLYFWFGRALFGTWGTRGRSMPLDDGVAPVIEGVAALVLLVIVAGQWIFTGSRAAMQFTETELAFLYPAPLSRRMLVRYKLLRGQLGTLLSATFLTLFTGRFATDGRVVYHILSWWLVLTLLSLHSLGASFTVQRLTERGLSSWTRRGLALGVVALVAASVFLWIRALPGLPEWQGDPRAMAGSFGDWVELALTTGPGPWVLLPFRWAVQPWFATNGLEFLQALVPVLLLFGLLFWWVERCDVAFEEASLQLSEKRAQLVAQVRAGKRTGLEAPRSLQRPPFALAPVGLPAIGLMWKNLIAARATPRKLAWITGGVVLAGLFIQFGPLPRKVQFIICGLTALSFLVWALIGGAMTSAALRRDLGMLDVLRGYPLPGWQLVLGELLGPAVVILSTQALCLLTVLLTLPPLGADQPNSWPEVLVAALAALFVVAPLNLVNALVPSAATLLFPAWATPGRDIQQPGFEALGQRLVFGIAQILVTLVALAPAVVLAGGGFLLVRAVAGVLPALLVAGGLASVVLAVEATIGIWILGRLFDQYDASAEQ